MCGYDDSLYGFNIILSSANVPKQQTVIQDKMYV